MKQDKPVVQLVLPFICLSEDSQKGKLVEGAYLHDGVRVREDGAVAVAKVEAPDLDVLVGRAADEERGVAADVHAQHRQLVPIQRQEELERVHEEHLRQHVSRHFHKSRDHETAEKLWRAHFARQL